MLGGEGKQKGKRNQTAEACGLIYKPKNPNTHLPPAATTIAPSVTPQRKKPVSTPRARAAIHLGVKRAGCNGRCVRWVDALAIEGWRDWCGCTGWAACGVRYEKRPHPYCSSHCHGRSQSFTTEDSPVSSLWPSRTLGNMRAARTPPRSGACWM